MSSANVLENGYPPSIISSDYQPALSSIYCRDIGKMNWTGGRLQRHSRNSAGKSLNYTQKQHFAKVRSRLQTGQRAVSPLDFALLHAVRDAREGRESRTESRSESRPKRQKTLSEYASTAPLANRLNAMKSRQVSLGRGTGKELHHRSMRPKPASAGSGSRAQDAPSADHRPSRISNATAREQINEFHSHRHEVASRSKPESNRRDACPTTQPLVGNSQAAGSQSLEDKRQSLLQQGDWVCTAITRPLRMNFLSSNNREKVGRRRRISTEERTRRILPISRRVRPSIRDGLLPQAGDWGHQGCREDISVRIGGQVHGSQRTTLPGVPEVLSQSQHHSMSSESMLLDKEDRWYGAQGPVSLTAHTSLLSAHSQHLVPDDVLWRSKTNSASESVRSSSSGAGIEGLWRMDKLQPELYYLVEKEDEKGHRDFPHRDNLSSDEQRPQASSKSSMQNLGHPLRPDIAEASLTKTTVGSAEYGIENRVGLRNRDGGMSGKKDGDLAPMIPDTEPLRLIFDSTPQDDATSQLSDTRARSKHTTQAIRSTVAEASDDTKDVVVHDSDEIEWGKLVMRGSSPKTDAHGKSSLPKAESCIQDAAETEVVITPLTGINETAWRQQNLQRAANEQSTVAPVDEVHIKRNARLQTEDEIWMKFLDISGDTEEEPKVLKGLVEYHTVGRIEASDNSKISASSRRPINESISAQASSTSFTRAVVESSSLSSAHLMSDTASSKAEGLKEQTSAISPHSPIRSIVAIVHTSLVPFTSETSILTAATVHTSSPDPLAARTSMAPSIAAATAHSSSIGSLLPSTSLTPPRSGIRALGPPQTSSPDPLTLTSASAHVAPHKKGPRAAMEPPSPQRVIFTKPTPFTGRRVSASAIRNASRMPLHLGRAIAGSSSKSKSVPKHAKATPRAGVRKGRDKSGGLSRTAARSIYSIPSTDSDIEDVSEHENATETIEADDSDLLEQI